jgi:hypothetical protein
MKLYDILNEAINYEDMFSKLYSVYEQNEMNISSLKNTINEIIKTAKNDLKREDRIIWFVRLYKIYYLKQELPGKLLYRNPEAMKIINKDLVNTSKKANFDINNDTIVRPVLMLSNLRHFLSLPIPEIQNFIFTNQKYEEILQIFRDFEYTWRTETKGLVAPKDGDKIVVKFNDNTAWWLLARGACKEEAEAMGHCGNVPSQKSGERILSFRSLKQENMWKPHLTFILDKDGKIGEAKGRGNEKPTEKYHPYIAKLLMKSDLIKGIKGGGYRPENNFKLSDLSDELRDKVFDANKNIEEASMSIWEKYQTVGLTDEVKREAEKIIDRTNIDTSHIEFDEDGKSVIVYRYDDLEKFGKYTDFDLLYNAIKLLDDQSDDPDLDELQERFEPTVNDYVDIFDRLTDTYLNKLKKSINYDGNDLTDLADLFVNVSEINTKAFNYNTELKKAMIDASSGYGSSFDKEEFIEYINSLVKLYVNSSNNHHIYVNDIKSEDDNIILRMPIDDFMTFVYLIEFMEDNDDIHEAEYADEDDVIIYYDIINDNSFLPVNNWNLRDSIEYPDNYLDKDQYEIFKKYEDYDISSGVSQNFDITVAVKYFTKYVDLTESNNMSRLKTLAGIK